MLYLSCFDVDPGESVYVRRWITEKHLPDLLAAGFLSASSYEEINGSGRTADIYEIPEIGIFATPAYRATGSDLEDPARPRALAAMSNRSNTTYRVHAEHGDISVDNSEIVTLVQFEAAVSSAPEFVASLQQACVSAMDSGSGLLERVRVCERSGSHPDFPSEQPNWLIMLQWRGLPRSQELTSLTRKFQSVAGDYGFISDWSSRLLARVSENAEAWS
jgi:hypothetical protein